MCWRTTTTNTTKTTAKEEKTRRRHAPTPQRRGEERRGKEEGKGDRTIASGDDKRALVERNADVEANNFVGKGIEMDPVAHRCPRHLHLEDGLLFVACEQRKTRGRKGRQESGQGDLHGGASGILERPRGTCEGRDGKERGGQGGREEEDDRRSLSVSFSPLP